MRKRNSIIVNLILLYLQETFYIRCLEYFLFSYLKNGKTIPNQNKVTCSSVIVSTKKGVGNEIYHTRIKTLPEQGTHFFNKKRTIKAGHLIND